jgi:multidrug transporter EmrE-like cation transporter
MNPRALVFLVLAIAAEVAGTAGLKASEEFGRLGPSTLAVLGYGLAFYLLAQSLKYFPLGVAYAIWSGLGTVGSVLLGLLTWKEILWPVHVFAIALIVVGVVVLNVVPATEQGAPRRLIHQSAWKGAFSEVRTSILHGSSGNPPEDVSALVLRVGVKHYCALPLH